jgi:hypothetical protein
MPATPWPPLLGLNHGMRPLQLAVMKAILFSTMSGGADD